MSELLGFVPVLASFVLGVIYLTAGDGSPALKGAGVAVFGLGVYLQFFSGQMLAGVLLLVALALTLEMWRRFNT
jgi:hypothetical protein